MLVFQRSKYHCKEEIARRRLCAWSTPGRDHSDELLRVALKTKWLTWCFWSLFRGLLHVVVEAVADM